MDKEIYIKILQDIIQINTVNNNEEQAANYIKKFLNTYNIQSELVRFAEGRSALIAEIEHGQGKTLALSGHLDVVSAGDHSDWTHPPFSAEITDGKLYGRGSSDMKSGLVALLIAFVEKSQTKDFNGKIRLIFTVGEESGGIGAKQLSDLGYVDDVDGLLIGEPVGHKVLYAHKGFFNYTIRSSGKAVHSSVPENGVNAINQLLPIMEKLNTKFKEIKNAYKNNVLGETKHSITIINGGHQQNTIPDFAEFHGNIRTIPEFDNDKITELISEIVGSFNQQKDTQLELEIRVSLFPMEAKKESELIHAIVSQLSDPIDVTSSAGATDAALFYQANPNMDVAIFGPGEPSVTHQIDEYVKLNNYLEYIGYYKNSISAYLK